jgi:hypothetical protein
MPRDRKATIPKDAAAPAVMPGVVKDTFGSIIVTEGWGSRCVQQEPEAATSFLFVIAPSTRQDA